MPTDDNVWGLYAKGVKKIRRAKTVKHPSRLREELKVGRETQAQHPDRVEFRHQPMPSPPVSGRGKLTATPQQTLDRRTEKNLRHGKIALHARIDLHGKTQPEAQEALARFMASAVKAGQRNLLIITGKGRGNAGVLKTNLSLWLHALPEATQILALRPAAPQHGGDGAFYMILRKGPGTRSRGSGNL